MKQTSVLFSTQKVPIEQMPMFYNIADVTQLIFLMLKVLVLQL